MSGVEISKSSNETNRMNKEDKKSLAKALKRGVSKLDIKESKLLTISVKKGELKIHVYERD